MHDTLFMPGRQRQHRCTSRIVGLYAVNFTRLHACRCAGWAGRQGIIWSCWWQSPCISPYNTLGNAATAMSQLLQHSCELQRWCRKWRPASAVPPPPLPLPHLRCTQWDDRQNSHITQSTVEWKKGLNIGNSWATTCTFFTNLTRWKFPYENRLVEILRESYDNLIYEQCTS